MKFIHRLGYYLGGFAIGLIILAFILSGKNASCDYGPNARTTKNISSKPISYSKAAEESIAAHQLDSAGVIQLIRYGTVDFSKSIITEDSCNTYYITNSYKDDAVMMLVLNCNDSAILKVLNFE
jgi:hypothetical protein